jgi:hypothetical protein
MLRLLSKFSAIVGVSHGLSLREDSSCDMSSEASEAGTASHAASASKVDEFESRSTRARRKRFKPASDERRKASGSGLIRSPVAGDPNFGKRGKGFDVIVQSRRAGEKPQELPGFQCPKCNRVFRYYSTFHYHMRRRAVLLPDAEDECGEVQKNSLLAVGPRDSTDVIIYHQHFPVEPRSTVKRAASRKAEVKIASVARKELHVREEAQGEQGQYECGCCKLQFTCQHNLSKHISRSRKKNNECAKYYAPSPLPDLEIRSFDDSDFNNPHRVWGYTQKYRVWVGKGKNLDGWHCDGCLNVFRNRVSFNEHMWKRQRDGDVCPQVRADTSDDSCPFTKNKPRAILARGRRVDDMFERRLAVEATWPTPPQSDGKRSFRTGVAPASFAEVAKMKVTKKASTRTQRDESDSDDAYDEESTHMSDGKDSSAGDQQADQSSDAEWVDQLAENFMQSVEEHDDSPAAEELELQRVAGDYDPVANAYHESSPTGVAGFRDAFDFFNKDLSQFGHSLHPLNPLSRTSVQSLSDLAAGDFPPHDAFPPTLHLPRAATPAYRANRQPTVTSQRGLQQPVPAGLPVDTVTYQPPSFLAPASQYSYLPIGSSNGFSRARRPTDMRSHAMGAAHEVCEYYTIQLINVVFGMFNFVIDYIIIHQMLCIFRSIFSYRYLKEISSMPLTFGDHTKGSSRKHYRVMTKWSVQLSRSRYKRYRTL